PPASGDSKGKWNEQAHGSGNILLAQKLERTLTNNLRRDQAPKARDQRLHSDGKQNEGNAKEDAQEAPSRRAAEKRAGQAHRANPPRANVPQAARLDNDHIGSQRSQRQQPFGEHGSSADGMRIGLDIKLLGRAGTAHQAMPAGDGPAGNGNEQNRP